MVVIVKQRAADMAERYGVNGEILNDVPSLDSR